MNTQTKIMPHLALIGMSNIGKSSWSRRLERTGYRRVDCDALIAARLGTGPIREDDQRRGIREMAAWLGQPDSPDYAARSALYAGHEAAVMRAALDDLDSGAPTVIDTTGSVIYCPDDILRDLTAATRIVYLDSSDAHHQALYERFIKAPKPVLWDAHYQPLSGEDASVTRGRCYPNLLRDRATRYKALAHATIPFARHQDRRADPLQLFLS